VIDDEGDRNLAVTPRSGSGPSTPRCGIDTGLASSSGSEPAPLNISRELISGGNTAKFAIVASYPFPVRHERPVPEGNRVFGTNVMATPTSVPGFCQNSPP
jgi:hypothetical protein